MCDLYLLLHNDMLVIAARWSLCYHERRAPPGASASVVYIVTTYTPSGASGEQSAADRRQAPACGLWRGHRPQTDYRVDRVRVLCVERSNRFFTPALTLEHTYECVRIYMILDLEGNVTCDEDL
ncbi:unnamed protein product [Danaus chrysippus]|uniref:(African queen) hypothetical protein n=1 Tax=Danaus chrysippus TaxID=151541 RepID=A0A8J2W2N2_9NEOP|nr:unnamed protein product [Danaus chrysippus]